MAEVFPFRGWRYNPGLVDVGLVTAPPYDVIDVEGQAFYHQRHPNNIIRLILGQDQAGDDEICNKYARAWGFLDDWRRRHVLVQEDVPAVYLYRQDFSAPGTSRAHRTGLIADLTLSPLSAGIVRPHERTLSKPKEDRLKLIRATGFQLSQIFMLYEDAQAELHPWLGEKPERPAADLTDSEGVRHRVWPLTDAAVIGKIKSFFAQRPVYIADGHHRYETSLAYRDELLMAGRPLGEAGTVAVVLVELDQPGLFVFPTHRAVHSLPAWDEEWFKRAVGEYFRLAPFDGGVQALARSIDGHPHTFGFVLSSGAYRAVPIGEARTMAAMPADRAPAWQRLDVSILHSLVLHKIMGITEEAQARQENLIYTRDPAEVGRMVAEGQAQFGVLLGPTPVRQVKDVADARETMPQKSTYFWPKLLSGLVLKEL